LASELKHVYCYQIGSDNCYKIGRTKGAPDKRMRGFATGSPAKLKLYRDELTENASALEQYIHQLLDASRTENGEFFKVTAQELDDAIDQAVTFMKELLPLLDGAKKLRRKKPDETMIDPSDEMLDIYRQLREASRERFLLERRIELLESKIQVVIGENRGMTGVASWKWNDCWKMDTTRLKKEKGALYAELYEEYKRNSGSRKFCLERVDLTQGER
jgi:hypothetical protein